MTKKGQIVEIPASALIYSRELPVFHSKKDELIWKSRKIEYSLFDGFLVGEHQGVENFRIGQRKGINVGGKKSLCMSSGLMRKRTGFCGSRRFASGTFDECYSSWRKFRIK
jgi:tRNA U34 2-thiouridine synthase MnmA/TrmU